MLIEDKLREGMVKVNPTFRPAENSYPHYRMIPMQTEAGKYHCLLFYISEHKYLMLEPRLKRYQVIKRLAAWLETAPFAVFEVVYK